MSKFKPQFRRLIFIDTMIRRGDYPNCSRIAKEYEVNARTITRDIEYMRDMLEAPIEYDKARRGYYYTEQTYMLPAIEISDSDLFTLCIAERALEQYVGTPLYEKLETVFRKLSALLPESVSVSASWLGEGYTFMPESSTAIKAGVWEMIATSLRGRNALEIEHRKAAGEVTRRVVHPYHVASYKGEWYLIAYCTKRSEVLRFAISRITAARITDAHYTIPEDFDFSRFMGESFGIMTESTPFTVRILFTGRAAPYIAERTWHEHQTIEENADGTLVLIFPATSIMEVKRWVLSWGAEAKVLGPEELVKEVIEELRSAAEKYT